MTAAAVACTSCGAPPARAGARYCDACGCPLTTPTSHGEFKQVTVLFADVVGSMDVAAAVGAERLREIIAGLVGRLANMPEYEGSAVCDIWLLRLRVLLALVIGDDAAYRDLVSRYRAMAKSLGFEGHIAMAEAM